MLLYVRLDGAERHLEVGPTVSGDHLLLKALDLFGINPTEKESYALLRRGERLRLKDSLMAGVEDGDVLDLVRKERVTHRKGFSPP